MNEREKSQSSAAVGLDSASPNTGRTEKDYLDYVAEQRQKAEAEASEVTFLAADEEMLRIRSVIEQIRDTDVSVLISGESGTGKEVVARTVHNRSNRSSGPFVAVNCAALPSNLLESELFGFEKGAFTGAHQRHLGKFEQANGGTLLLDEVTEMDPNLQAKLLRALQEKEIERIGGKGPVPINTRIIATTNRDIAADVAKGSFRQDLYYRLYVIQLEIPPLRKRPQDIQILADHFLGRYSQQFAKPGVRFSDEAMAKLQAHSWRGNVRELQNIVQRSVLLAAGDLIGPGEVPIDVEKTKTDEDWVSHLPIGRALKDLETQFILETLKHHSGNRTHAARTLGISLRTLRNKINEFTAHGYEVMAPTSGRAVP